MGEGKSEGEKKLDITIKISIVHVKWTILLLLFSIAY